MSAWLSLQLAVTSLPTPSPEFSDAYTSAHISFGQDGAYVRATDRERILADQRETLVLLPCVSRSGPHLSSVEHTYMCRCLLACASLLRTRSDSRARAMASSAYKPTDAPQTHADSLHLHLPAPQRPLLWSATSAHTITQVSLPHRPRSCAHVLPEAEQALSARASARRSPPRGGHGDTIDYQPEREGSRGSSAAGMSRLVPYVRARPARSSSCTVGGTGSGPGRPGPGDHA